MTDNNKIYKWVDYDDDGCIRSIKVGLTTQEGDGSKSRFDQATGTGVHGDVALLREWSVSNAADLNKVEADCHSALEFAKWKQATANKYDRRNGRDDLIKESLREKFVPFPGRFKDFETKKEAWDYFNIEADCIITDVIRKHTGKSGLPTWVDRAYQDFMMSKIVDDVKSGAKLIAAEFAPRFGKTGTTLNTCEAELLKLGYQNIIVSAYFLSAASSYQKEAAAFDNFTIFDVIDTKKMTAEAIQERIDSNDKPKLFIVSLCGTIPATSKKLAPLINLPKESKLNIIEEADFGCHTSKSMTILENLNTDVRLLLTGSAMDRALSPYGGDIKLHQFSYMDMLLTKSGEHPFLDNYPKEERDEAVNSCKDLVVPNFIKPDYSIPATIQETLPDNMKATWTGVGKSPKKAKILIESILRGMYLSDPGATAEEVIQNSHLLGLTEACKLDVSMIFTSCRTTKALEEFIEIAENTLGGDYVVIPVHGKVTTNAKAEKKVSKKVVEAQANKKKVVIITSGMAQRSFSISEIDTTILMYDKGDRAATGQKLSRGLTSGTDYDGNVKQSATIVSLSLDANRSEGDPINDYIYDTAIRLVGDEVTLQEAIRRTCNSVNIFKTDGDGIIRVEPDIYTAELINSSSFLSSMKMKIANPTDLKDSFIKGGYELIGGFKKSSSNKTDSDKVFVNTDDAVNGYIVDDKIVEGEKDVVIKDEEAKQIAERVEAFMGKLSLLKALDSYQNDDIISAMQNIKRSGSSSSFLNSFSLQLDYVLSLLMDKKLPVGDLNTIYEFVNVDVDFSDLDFNW